MLSLFGYDSNGDHFPLDSTRFLVAVFNLAIPEENLLIQKSVRLGASYRAVSGLTGTASMQRRCCVGIKPGHANDLGDVLA